MTRRFFPRPRFPIQNKDKDHPFYYESKFNKLYNYGCLDYEKVIEPSYDYCFFIQKNLTINDFSWKGAKEGMFVGSNDPTPRKLRDLHKPINVEIHRAFCEDVGRNAIQIFAESKVLIKDCCFRGNYKMVHPYLAGAPGQDNLIEINGGEVTIDNCLFFNSKVPIIIKASSKVIIKNSFFSVCDVGIFIDGRDNPRQNDTYYKGRGPASLEIENTSGFKTNVLTRAETGSKVSMRNCEATGRLYIEDGGTVTIQ